MNNNEAVNNMEIDANDEMTDTSAQGDLNNIHEPNAVFSNDNIHPTAGIQKNGRFDVAFSILYRLLNFV